MLNQTVSELVSVFLFQLLYFYVYPSKGSLLFAASSIAVSNLNFRHNKNGDTCLIGFPFSLRPFLISHNRSPLSVQLGFGGIQLPLTPCYTNSNTFKLRFKNRAHLSQCQFDKLLNSPTLLQDSLCSSYNRAKSFDAGHDGWKSSKPNSTGTAIVSLKFIMLLFVGKSLN